MRWLRAIFFLVIIAVAGLTAAIFILPEPEGFPILEYHTITDNPTPDSEVYNVPPAEFAAQLDYLKENGYTTITLRKFMQVLNGKGKLPDKPIILTFDDGYEDNFTEMLPILEAHNMTAVVYVITNLLDKPGYLTVAQLQEMQRRNIEIGSHTADHIALNWQSDHVKMNQIRGSKNFLEMNGLAIETFSYPNGGNSEIVAELLKQEGYLNAVTGDVGLNNLKTNPYFLRRVHIRRPRFGIAEFKFRLWKAKIFAKFRD